MEKLVQWMTVPELRDELERRRQAWETTDLEGVLADGQLPPLSQDTVADSGPNRPRTRNWG
jgi:hypothetical protein